MRTQSRAEARVSEALRETTRGPSEPARAFVGCRDRLRSDTIRARMNDPSPASDELPMLLEVGALLGSEIAFEDLLVRLVDEVREHMACDRATIFLVDRARGELFSKVAHLPELPEIRLSLGQGVAGWVAQTGEVVSVPTTHSDARFFAGVDELTGYRTESILAIPMIDRVDEVIGVVQLLNKRGGAFDESDLAKGRRLASEASRLIEATTLYDDLSSRRPTEPAPAPTASSATLMALDFSDPTERRPEALLIQDRFNRIVGESESLREACRRTRKAAASSATVLIRGESGTGKELFARAVHVNSARRDRPFVKVDCAALPETLIENELFGHERGAFTGADQKAKGKFDLADGGTIFLDEIGELPLAVQGKLLRVLQDREFVRVGGQDLVRVDVRVVAATNRDLLKMVGEQRFRADLYYRIRVVELGLPPLAARGARDIARLARHFLTTAARRLGSSAPTLAPETLERLAAYPWPGNVRELENCIESALVVMDGSVILPEHLPLPDRVDLASESRPEGHRGLRTLEEVEREHVLFVLETVQGNQSEAARVLAIGRNTLARKLRSYGIS